MTLPSKIGVLLRCQALGLLDHFAVSIRLLLGLTTDAAVQVSDVEARFLFAGESPEEPDAVITVRPYVLLVFCISIFIPAIKNAFMLGPELVFHKHTGLGVGVSASASKVIGPTDHEIQRIGCPCIVEGALGRKLPVPVLVLLGDAALTGEAVDEFS